jgi:hypothetical protein
MMPESERDPEAVRQYERTVRAVAERQVVDEAENLVAHAWIAELDEMRRTALRLAAAARLAENAARIELRTAQELGRPVLLAKAQARLTVIEAEQEDSIDRAHALLAAVDTALEAIRQAGLERAQRNKQDLHLMRDAWAAAYGPGDAPQ